jgi:hypothetical protein
MENINEKELKIIYTSSVGNIKEKIYSFLYILENTTLPRPVKIMWTDAYLDWRESLINSFLDSKLISKIEPLQRHIDMYDIWIDYNSEDNINVRIGQSYSDSIIIYFSNKLMERYSVNFCKNLFISILLELPKINTARCVGTYDEIYKRSFKDIERPYLGWIQYINNSMILERGGFEIFESNPYLQTERIHDGLLIQVGESPYDAFTPEGEELLVKATRSLPPVKNIS